jgi:hypothetical protein
MVSGDKTMFDQKRNQLMPTLFVLVAALAVLSFVLVRSVSTLLISTNSETTTIEVVAVEPFDYTRDRDQYWQPVAVVAFDYTRDRDQYWQTVVVAEPFDYTRDRDQYWQTVVVAEPFDYTRDRDQYWYPIAPSFDYTRDREQYEPS